MAWVIDVVDCYIMPCGEHNYPYNHNSITYSLAGSSIRYTVGICCWSLFRNEGKKMSYDIQLCDPVSHKTLHTNTKHEIGGGTQAIGGTTELWLNITYNYAKFFRETIDKDEGIRFLYGKTGAESIPILEKAISQLDDNVDDDYWKATEGNAKRALCGLLAFAQLRPDGIWDGD